MLLLSGIVASFAAADEFLVCKTDRNAEEQGFHRWAHLNISSCYPWSRFVQRLQTELMSLRQQLLMGDFCVLMTSLVRDPNQFSLIKFWVRVIEVVGCTVHQSRCVKSADYHLHNNIAGKFRPGWMWISSRCHCWTRDPVIYSLWSISLPEHSSMCMKSAPRPSWR